MKLFKLITRVDGDAVTILAMRQGQGRRGVPFRKIVTTKERFKETMADPQVRVHLGLIKELPQGRV